MLEVLLIASFFVLGLLPVLAGCYRTRQRAIITAVILFLMVSAVATAWRGDHAEVSPVENRPVEVLSDGYVTSESCQACHPQSYATWQATYHRTMTQVAAPDTVEGDFDDVDLHDESGRRYHLTRDQEEFFVELDDPDISANRVRHPIVMTTGSHHYQAYWFSTGQGRELGMLPFIHLIDHEQYGEPRWILRRAAFLRPPARPGAEARPLKKGRWNQVCYMCHATRGQPRLHDRLHADTHAVEFGIACESCHGPGAGHVTANQSPLRRYDLHQGNEPDSTIVNPERLSHERSSQICGQCHSVITPKNGEQWDQWHDEGFAYRPGDDLAETRQLDPDHFVLRDDNVKRLEGLVPNPVAHLAYTFWPDGMIRVSGREYSGLIATPCYQHGTMSCLSCHQMHKSPDDPRTTAEWANDQLKPGMRGNEACYQCHSSYRDQLEEHTHHSPESAGSQCYNCHMPHTSYGLLKAIRSHALDSPDVAHSVAPVGRPNACNQCHLDKTLGWTADRLSQWYGIEPPELTDDERSISATLLWLLKGDAAQRALAAWTMSWKPAQEVSGTDWMPPFLTQLLLDPYDSNRFIAERTMRHLPGIGDFQYDFMAPSKKRWEQGGVLFERWRRANATGSGPTDAALLYDKDGHLLFSEMQRLLKQRDNRRMYLNE